MEEIDLSPLRSALSEIAPQGPSALLPALHTVQSIYGYISEPAAAEVGRALGIPLVDVYGVIAFYAMFYRAPVGKTMVRVCTDPACALAGGDQLLAAACQRLGVSPDQVTQDGAYTVERSPCLGLCDQAPVALVGETAVTRIDPSQVERLFAVGGDSPESHGAGEL